MRPMSNSALVDVLRRLAVRNVAEPNVDSRYVRLRGYLGIDDRALFAGSTFLFAPARSPHGVGPCALPEIDLKVTLRGANTVGDRRMISGG